MGWDGMGLCLVCSGLIVPAGSTWVRGDWGIDLYLEDNRSCRCLQSCRVTRWGCIYFGDESRDDSLRKHSPRNIYIYLSIYDWH